MAGPLIDHDIRGACERLREEAHVIPEPLRDWWIHYLDMHIEHYRSVIARLPNPKACGRLLEIGCVPGHLTVLLAGLGYDITGVDIAPARVSELWRRHGIEICRVDIESEPLPFEDQAFSCVLFTEILEHLRMNPIHALREAARLLGSGGRLILSVPNITPIDRLGFLLGRDYQGDIIAEFQKLERCGHMGHIRLYSINEVRRLLNHVGFFNVRCAREGRLRGGWLTRLPFPWRDAFRSHVYFESSRYRELGAPSEA
ncbi:MAG: class I SAM-dependent methyltransferase [Planctomycetes bacterium]|nr:class I SAM-dependent methyltransferase [Planctomycetota bacterium]